MKNCITKKLLSCAAIAAVACSTALATKVTFEQINLVSDQNAVALLRDPALVNAWGISFAPTGPFWISANGAGLSMIYTVTNDSLGNPQVTKSELQVSIPGDGTPTGQVFDESASFNGDSFLFASEDGTISGWRADLGTDAEVLVSRTNAVYKGITIALLKKHVPVILAANFAEGTVDEYDTNLTLIAQLVDTKAPAGYAPFNVAVLDGTIFVTFAKQDEFRHDDVPGAGHGFIDVLVDLKKGKFHRFITGADAGGHNMDINSPWGMVLSPKKLKSHGDQLLVGNFGDGTIMSFTSGANSKGLLQSDDGGNVVIDGLWGLSFGNGANAGDPDTLYFTAGPNGESHGLFGALVPTTEKNDNDSDDGNNN